LETFLYISSILKQNCLLYQNIGPIIGFDFY